MLNENQFEQSYWAVAAWQRSINGADVQVSYFSRYSSVHFVPDVLGDLIFNGVASDVYRSSLANGVTTDIAYRLNDSHTLRGGILLRTEKTQVTNTSVVEPLDAAGAPDRCALHNRRSEPFDWLHGWSVHAGRMAADRQDHVERRSPLRSVLGIYHRVSVQPPRQPHLEAVRQHDVSRRLRAHVHAALAGARRTDQSGAGRQHDAAAERSDRRSGAGGTRRRL